jgi:hypothetical protein
MFQRLAVDADSKKMFLSFMADRVAVGQAPAIYA